jgi:hypothetical protein
MDVQIDPKYIRASVLSVVLFIVLLTSLAGFRAGRDLAKADVTLKQVDVLMKGLDYFYNDQDRYPSATEFEDKSALGTYVSSLPVNQVTSTQCGVTLAYDTFDERAFTLSYCLPRGAGAQLPGIHKISERDIPSFR